MTSEEQAVRSRLYRMRLPRCARNGGSPRRYAPRDDTGIIAFILGNIFCTEKVACPLFSDPTYSPPEGSVPLKRRIRRCFHKYVGQFLVILFIVNSLGVSLGWIVKEIAYSFFDDLSIARHPFYHHRFTGILFRPEL